MPLFNSARFDRAKAFPLSRRAVLRGLGVGAGLVPLLNATRSNASDPAFPKRLVIMSKGGGNIAKEFWPRGEGTDLSKLTLGGVTKQLEPYRAYLNFVGGLSIESYKGPGDGHLNYGSILTGRGAERTDNNPASGPSIDWVIGQEMKKRNSALAFATLAASVNDFATLGLGQVSWQGARQPNTAEFDPYKLFEKVFAGRTVGEDPKLVRRRAENRSLLDFSAKRIEAFGRRLGTEDQQKIDSHLTAVRAIEKQLAEAGATACAAPKIETAAMPRLRVRDSVNTPTLLKLQTDIILAALRCDLTRVATINIGDTFGDGLWFEWLGLKRTYHGIKHKNGQNFDSWLEEEMKVEPWLLSNFTYLLEGLKGAVEGSETMLDHSVAFWCDALSNGTNHQYRGMPWILAGSCNGYFKTGQNLRYGGWAKAPGNYWENREFIPHNALLVSLARAMDLEISSFGEASFGMGELAGLKR